jgi:hypothetical protein
MSVYFITSLPKLYINIKPKISKKEFVTQARNDLPQSILKDLDLLINLDTEQVKLGENSILGTTVTDSILRGRLINIFKETNSLFLKKWVKYLVNIQEIVTVLLCKKEDLSQQKAKDYFTNSFDSTSKFVLKNYHLPDFGLSKRFTWFNKLNHVMQGNDIIKTQKTIDLIKLQEIDFLKPTDVFHIDTLLAYYLELSILERAFSFDRVNGRKQVQNILNSFKI